MSIEFELKFGVPAESRDALVREMDDAGAAAVHMRAVYFDTPDGRLHASGMALRLRHESRGWVQTVKQVADPSAPWRRLEHEVEVSTADVDSAPPLNPRLHEGSPAASALRYALGVNPANASFVERYRTDVQRRTREIVADGALVEAAFDEGEIVAGNVRLKVCELELELKSGDPDALFSVERDYVDAHGLWLEHEPKSARGERLVGGVLAPEVARAIAPTLAAAMSADAFARAVVRACLAHLLPNAAAVAQGCLDDEHVHQLRVAIRRTRTALRELRGFTGDVRGKWSKPLRRAFAALGASRDVHVVMGQLRTRLMAAGASGTAWIDTEGPAPQTLVDAVRERLLQRTLLQLIAFASAAPAVAADDDRPLVERSSARLGKLHRAVVRRGESFDTLDDDDRHAVRKRVKRLRYLCEFAAPLYPPEAVAAYLAVLRDAQDALGVYSDLAVGMKAAQAAARRGSAEAAEAVKLLAKERKTRVRACRLALRAVGAAPVFWAAPATDASRG